MNSECPFCGGRLEATVDQRYVNVPLRDDGYIPEWGDHVSSEVSNVHCPECGRKLSSEYYHDDECRLKTAVRAAVSKTKKDKR